MSDDLKDLDEKIRAFRTQERKEDVRESKEQDDAESMNMGVRAGAELIASIVAGILIGLGLDSLFHTEPLFVLLFFFGGILTGFWNIYRLTQNFDSSVGFSRLQNDSKNVKRAPENDNNPG